MDRLNEEDMRELQNVAAEKFGSALNLVLYLCSEGADVARADGKTGQPEMPPPVKTKKGLRHFQADGTTVWNVGFKWGEKLRYAQEQFGAQNTSKGVNPHVRRAHWHSWIVGPKKAEKRMFRIKWLYPIIVNASKLSFSSENRDKAA